MTILILVIFYLFILSIHIVFVGVTSYAMYGKVLNKMERWKVVLLLMVPLVFFEFYWIPVFKALDLQVFVGDTSMHEFFGITRRTNIVESFNLTWYQPIVFLVSGILANRIGKYFYKQNNK